MSLRFLRWKVETCRPLRAADEVVESGQRESQHTHQAAATLSFFHPQLPQLFTEYARYQTQVWAPKQTVSTRECVFCQMVSVAEGASRRDRIRV